MVSRGADSVPSRDSIVLSVPRGEARLARTMSIVEQWILDERPVIGHRSFCFNQKGKPRVFINSAKLESRTAPPPASNGAETFGLSTGMG